MIVLKTEDSLLACYHFLSAWNRICKYFALSPRALFAKYAHSTWYYGDTRYQVRTRIQKPARRDARNLARKNGT